MSFIAISVLSQSQSLTFSGKMKTGGASMPLDSIRVENITKNTSTVLTGNNIILGIDEMVSSDPVGIVRSYPNPFREYTNIEFATSQKEQITVIVTDITGKTIVQLNHNVESGSHSFRFAASRTGIYIVSVNCRSFSHGTKVFCNQNNNNKPLLTYLGNTINTQTKIVNPQTKIASGNVIKSQSPVSDQSEASGQSSTDMYRFIGYSGGYATSIYDVVDADGSYIFEFDPAFYRFQSFKITSGFPCFVDIMFSVTNKDKKGADWLRNVDFKVLEDGSNVTSESFGYVKKLKQVPSKTKTVLMIDNSYSIGGNLGTLKTAAINFVKQMSANQEIALYSFSSTTNLLQDFTTNKTTLTNSINAITQGATSTNLYGSFIAGLAKWTDVYTADLIEQGQLVMFTDGDDTQGSSTLAGAVVARGLKRAYLVGLGTDINPTNLNSLSNTGPYFAVTNISQLSETFSQIQCDIVRYANSFYWLNYMSPKRSGTHSLTIEGIGNTNTEVDKTTLPESFSANGFVDVTAGVCANVSPTFPTGITSLDLYTGLSTTMNAVTYRATNPPFYRWTFSNKTLVTVTSTSLDSSKITITAKSTVGNLTITLKDLANSFTKSISLNVLQALPTLSTNTVSNITSTTADCGGNVTNQGAGPVTDRGVCWNTSSTPTILNNKISNGTGTGTFTCNITGLTGGITYYVRAYATNSTGTVYGSQISFTAPLGIGQSYQGGVIAYILQSGDPGYIAGVTHGIIAAPSDQSPIWWISSGYVLTGATGTALGTGNANTNTIVSLQGAGNYAAKKCYDLVLGGYDDWYLPSKDELMKLYINQTAIGGFGPNWYWSSSEYDLSNSIQQYFYTGFTSNGLKNNTKYFRPIRSF